MEGMYIIGHAGTCRLCSTCGQCPYWTCGVADLPEIYLLLCLLRSKTRSCKGIGHRRTGNGKVSRTVKSILCVCMLIVRGCAVERIKEVDPIITCNNSNSAAIACPTKIIHKNRMRYPPTLERRRDSL